MAMTRDSQEHTHLWGAPMTVGILLIIGGMFAFFASVATSLISIYFLGGMLLAAGILEIIAAFRIRHDSGRFLVYLLAGLLALAFGALTLYRPVASLGAVTLLVAGYLFTSALFRGTTSVADRYSGWGWDFAYAVVTFALGIYLVASLPVSALWVLGTLVAAEIISRGITLVSASSVLRRIEHGRARAAA